MYQVHLISHANDAQFANLLRSKFKQHNMTVLEYELVIEDEFSGYVTDIIPMVIVVTPDFLASPELTLIWAHALGNGNVIIPVNLNSTRLPAILQNSQPIDINDADLNHSDSIQMILDRIEITTSKTLDEAINLLNFGSIRQISYAIRVIKNMPQAITLPHILSVFNELPPKSRLEILFLFQDYLPVNEVKVLLRLLENDDDGMQNRIIRNLHYFPTDDVIQYLLNTVLGNTSIQIKFSAIKSLIRIGSNATPALLFLLTSDDARLRADIVLALSESSNTQAWEIILSLLDDEDAIVRKAVVRGVYELGSDQSMDLLIKIVSTDPNNEVRERALKYLIQFGNRVVLELAHVFDDIPYISTQKSIVSAIGELGGDKAYNLLSQFSKHPDAMIRLSVANSLANLSFVEQKKLLVQIINNDISDQVVDKATHNLLQLGLSAKSSVIELLRSDDSFIQVAILRAMNSNLALIYQDEIIDLHQYMDGLVRENVAALLRFCRSDEAYNTLVQMALKDTLCQVPN